MNALLKKLFAEPDPLKVDDLLSQIVKEASADPASWAEELPAAIAQAERQAQEANEISTERRRVAWLYIAGNKENNTNDGGISAEDVLKAKAAAFDADEEWIRWIAIEGDLQDLAAVIAKQKPKPEYMQ